MPALTYAYVDYSRETFSFEYYVREPGSTYGVDHPAPEICKRLGDDIRHLRTLRRWSREALGLEARLNRTLIGAIERAEVNTSIGTVEKIAQALGISVAELLSTKPIRYFDG
jgi:ribosome-binding protein aMBF1 (putative translation factor)